MILLTETCITQPWWMNFSSSEQYGRHFADDIFRCIFPNEKFCISIQISLKFVPESPFDSNPALV